MLPNVPSLVQTIKTGAEGGHEFARLCHHLLMHTATINRWRYDMCSDRSGDYRHLDGWSCNWSDLPDGLTGFQFKFYPSPLSKTHKTDIQEALESADAANPDMRRWIVILPEDLNKSDQEWFDELPHSQHLRIECWGHTSLLNMFLRYPELCDKYYPQLTGQAEHIVQTLKDIESARQSNERIESATERYLRMVRSLQNSDHGALALCGIGGMSRTEFDAVVKRITEHGERNPIARLEAQCVGKGVTAYEVLQFALSKELKKPEYYPTTWRLEWVISQLQTERPDNQ